MLPNSNHPDNTSEIFISGSQGRLQLVHSTVSNQHKNLNPYNTAIICHPHPLHGGSMHNKIVTIIHKTLHNAGINTVRFNFPGVGHSEGQFDNGVAEVEDLQAIFRWLRSRSDTESDNFLLAGFSFGAYIAAQVAALCDLEKQAFNIAQLLLVAPPVAMYDFSQININQACLVLQGAKDTVIDPEQVRQWVTEQGLHNHAMQLEWCDDAEHFFHGKLSVIANAIKLHCLV